MTTDVDFTMINDIQETTSNKMNTQILGIGLRLKKAREAMQLSEKDAAARLHLSVRFIEIMENEDFTNGPPVTFIRGYMRSYAKLLHIPENEIDEALNQLGINMAPSTALATNLNNLPLSNSNEQYIRWITYLITLLLVVLVGVWWSSHTRDKVEPIKTEAPITAPSTNPASPSTAAGPATAPVLNNAPLSPTATQSVPGAAPGNPAPPVASVTIPSTDSKPADSTQTMNVDSQNKEPNPTQGPINLPAQTTDETSAQTQTSNTAEQTPVQTDTDVSEASTDAISAETKPKPKRHTQRPRYLEEEEAPLMAVPEPGLDTQ